MAWLRLVRWRNLVIIALTQLMVWWCVVLPMSPQVLKATNFLALMLSTVFIAAAGYIINDYFDIKIDQRNRPGSVVLGKRIERKNAIIAHTLLNGLALAAVARIAFMAGHPEWMILQASCTIMLWLYSTTFKRQFASGNIMVALLTALTIMTLYVYEPALQQGRSLAVWIIIVYAYFAFVLTWMREIVKDMEDMEGDAAEGCATMPIKNGLAFATRFTAGLSILAVIPLGISGVTLLTHGRALMSVYVLVLLALPLLVWTIYLLRGKPTTSHYSACSRALKVIMVFGVLALLVHKFS
ncbi:MAG: geranylgeranylglycerol-phosphate geranylgeranyltransferase [Taibaiella sp.]|nr:geranylgeranylglycerol-phosphate geranylgeranyltransferase [Taibaiella sp.]